MRILQIFRQKIGLILGFFFIFVSFLDFTWKDIPWGLALCGLAGLPVGCFLAAKGLVLLYRARRQNEGTTSRAALYLVVGIVAASWAFGNMAFQLNKTKRVFGLYAPLWWKAPPPLH